LEGLGTLGPWGNTVAPELPGDVHYQDRRLLALYFDMKSMSVLDQLRALDAGTSTR
jgi:hypothetical protein